MLISGHLVSEGCVIFSSHMFQMGPFHMFQELCAVHIVQTVFISSFATQCNLFLDYLSPKIIQQRCITVRKLLSMAISVSKKKTIHANNNIDIDAIVGRCFVKEKQRSASFQDQSYWARLCSLGCFGGMFLIFLFCTKNIMSQKVSWCCFHHIVWQQWVSCKLQDFFSSTHPPFWSNLGYFCGSVHFALFAIFDKLEFIRHWH